MNLGLWLTDVISFKPLEFFTLNQQLISPEIGPLGVLVLELAMNKLLKGLLVVVKFISTATAKLK